MKVAETEAQQAELDRQAAVARMQALEGLVTREQIDQERKIGAGALACVWLRYARTSPPL